LGFISGKGDTYLGAHNHCEHYTSGSFKTSQNESDAVSKLVSFTLDTIGKHDREALITMPFCTSIGNLVNIDELLLWYKVKKFRFQATFVVTTSL
jgi:hypothetical protein